MERIDERGTRLVSPKGDIWTARFDGGVWVVTKHASERVGLLLGVHPFDAVETLRALGFRELEEREQ